MDVSWLELLPADPVAAMERFAAEWWPAAGGRDIAGLPDALRAYHRATGGAAEAGSAVLHAALEPTGRHDGLVVLGQEGDGVYDLLLNPAQTDPAVYYEGLGEGLVAEREPLSAFLLLFALSRAAQDTPMGGMAFVGADEAQDLVAPLTRVPLRPLRFPCPVTETYAGPGIVVQIGASPDGWFEAYVGVRHRALLEPLRALNLPWEHFDQ